MYSGKGWALLFSAATITNVAKSTPSVNKRVIRAVLEYIALELVDLGGRRCRIDHKVTIDVDHIEAVIMDEPWMT